MFGLIWWESARDDLADIWVAATPTERDDIAAVIINTERDLRDDPFEVGESRDGDRRVIIRGLLVVWVTVSRQEGLVRVNHVHRPQ